MVRSYDWSDLDFGVRLPQNGAGVRFALTEAARREVLARLLKLNHERYEEEVRMGLHEKKGSKGAGGRGSRGEKGKRGRKKKGEQEGPRLL